MAGYFVPGGTDTKLLDKAVKILADKLLNSDISWDYCIEYWEIKEYPDFLEINLDTNIEIALDRSDLNSEDIENAYRLGVDELELGEGCISNIILRINPAAFDANLIDVDTKANLTQLKNTTTRIVLRLAYLIRQALIKLKDRINYYEYTTYAKGKDPFIKLQHIEVQFVHDHIDPWNWTSRY